MELEKENHQNDNTHNKNGVYIRMRMFSASYTVCSFLGCVGAGALTRIALLALR